MQVTIGEGWEVNEMINRVAKAQRMYFWRMWGSVRTYAVMRCDAWDGPPIKSGLTDNEARDEADRLNAVAAIEAMREPTEAMVIAGCRHENMGDMAGRWAAMIDEALKDIAA